MLFLKLKKLTKIILIVLLVSSCSSTCYGTFCDIYIQTEAKDKASVLNEISRKELCCSWWDKTFGDC